MPNKIVAEVQDSKREGDKTVVNIRAEKLSPIPRTIMVEERARARSLVEAGVADTVSDVFTNRSIDLQGLTHVRNIDRVSSDYPETWEFEVVVR